MVTTRCDAENQVFLATHCDSLRSPFISPHSLSVNGSSSIAPGETTYIKSALHTAAQGSQYTIDYAYGVNWISIMCAPHSYFKPYPKFTFCSEWVAYAEMVTYYPMHENSHTYVQRALLKLK